MEIQNAECRMEGNMTQRDIVIEGKIARGYAMPLGAKNLVIVRAPHGYIACGYISSDVAERLSDAAAFVSGVATIDDLLSASIVKTTSAAEARGVRCGMTGTQALKYLL